MLTLRTETLETIRGLGTVVGSPRGVLLETSTASAHALGLSRTIFFESAIFDFHAYGER